MGRTALYRDPLPFRPARAEVQLEADILHLRMPDGRHRRHVLHGYAATLSDGVLTARSEARRERRFVRMLLLEREHERLAVVTPPDEGAVAPNVVRLPEPPEGAAIVDGPAWDALSEWMLGGGRLNSCSIPELARLAAIATPQFAVLIGEVAAQRALELAWAASGPLRGDGDFDAALHPLVSAARQSPRVAEALVAALAHAAGATRKKRRA